MGNIIGIIYIITDVRSFLEELWRAVDYKCCIVTSMGQLETME